MQSSWNQSKHEGDEYIKASSYIIDKIILKNVDMIEALKEKRNQLASVNVSSSEEAGSPCNTSVSY